jgi:tetratricopeptide (TPR) repeat protein
VVGTLAEQRMGNPAGSIGEPLCGAEATLGEEITSVPARWPMGEREVRRSGYPLTIPDALLQSEAMRQACDRRDFSEIFRLVNRRTGSSYAVMAAAVGKMTSSRVSDIIRGVRGIRGQHVIERVADGFGIPGEMLSLPGRPWEGSPNKSDPTESLPYVDPDNEPADGLGSLSAEGQGFEEGNSGSQFPDVLLVPIWIQGRRQIVPVSRRALLTGVAGAALQGIGAVPIRMMEHTSESRTMPLPQVDGPQIEAATEHLREMWHALVRADNLFGPRHAIASVHQQITILESLLDCSRGQQRMELLRLAAQYAESAAWLHEDSADMPSAAKWTGQAMEWAAESCDQAMVTWILFRRSQQATTKRKAAQTISLAQAVLRNGAVLTASMRAAAMQQEAHGYALDGDEVACHRRLDEAHDFAASSETKGDARGGHGDFCTQSYLEIQRANCWLSLHRPDLAVPVFERALAGLPDAYQRDRGLAQARLAVAYTEVQRYEEAVEQAASALSIAYGSGSVRTMYETVAAVNALGVAHPSGAVSELFDVIGESPEF